jgi:hypothetical protein
MILNPTILRTKTSTNLLKLLVKCKKYIKKSSNNKEADEILFLIEKTEKLHKQEMERVGYRKYEEKI